MSPRFGVFQKGKVRPIDNFAASYVNKPLWLKLLCACTYPRCPRRSGQSLVANVPESSDYWAWAAGAGVRASSVGSSR